MDRAHMWRELTQRRAFDLVVIGGGATGLGVALDAALRGYSVALLESHDFASGTSSRSTKLLHGGVRYLAQGNWALVKEALAERATLLHLAPHLAQPLAFVMPATRWWHLPFYGAGLWLYGLLAGHAGFGRTECLGRQATLARLPGLSDRGLWGGVQYWDAQFDDARFAVALARTAAQAGAVVLNHCPVVDLLRSPHTASEGGPGMVSGVRVRHALTGEEADIQAGCVVNATGVWVDGVRAMAQAAPWPGGPSEGCGALPPLVSPSQGVHLVVDASFMPASRALLVPRTPDGRVLFAVPWQGKLVLGTTDTARSDAPREPTPLSGEVAFILAEASRALTRPVRRADVRSVWVGLRPLVRPLAEEHGAAHAPGGTQHLSREHVVWRDANGLVTVTGGKWTTYRAMAGDVLRRCLDWGLLPQPSLLSQGGLTQVHRLVGAPAERAMCPPLSGPPGPHLHGAEAEALRKLPGAERDLAPGFTEAMVRFATRCEAAVTVEDVLARRSRLLFLDAALAKRMAPGVAAILSQEHPWPTGLADFIRLCDQCVLPAA